MHHVWGMLEWTANTLIFLLAGVIIGKETLHKIDASDWFILIGLYIVLSIIRCIVVAILYPALSRTGLKCSAEDAVFVAWAGLRGALAMSLALIVKKSDEIDISDKDADKIFFFVGGIAAITIMVNAVLSSKVLEKLGLLSTDSSPDKLMVLKQIQKRLRKKSLDLVTTLVRDMNISDPADVVQHNTLLKNYIRIANDDEPWLTDNLRTASGVRVQSQAKQDLGSANEGGSYGDYGRRDSGNVHLNAYGLFFHHIIFKCCAVTVHYINSMFCVILCAMNRI